MSLFTGWALADELQRRLAADARFADGVVFQHLVAGPVTITTLAEEVTLADRGIASSPLPANSSWTP